MSNTNRRTFLATSVAGASAAALVNGRLVHAAETNEAATKESKLSAAVVGVNGRGGGHITALIAAPDTTITIVCDVDEAVAEDRADKIAEKQGSRPKVVRDIRQVIDDKSVDLVSMATPNHWHALAGVWAMQAGKHAYIEKPICQNIQEGAALIAAAKKYGRICQVGTQCRSSTAIIDAIKFMNDGGIGTVNFARGLCYKRRKSIGPRGDYPIPNSVDFDLWSGPAPYTDPKLIRPKFHYDWHWQRLYGNGDFGNQGPHQTDIARWGLGLDRHPRSVLAYGGRLGYQAEKNNPNFVDAGDTPNTIVAIFDYGDKSIVFETRGLDVDEHEADAELNKLFGSNKGGKVGVVFYGSNGYLVQKTYTNCVAYDLNMNEIRQFNMKGDLNTAHFRNFLDAIHSGDSDALNADARVGHLSAGMSHIGNTSYYLNENNHVSESELIEAVSKMPGADDHAATVKRTMSHLKQNGVDLEKYRLSLGAYLEFDNEKEVYTNNEEANKHLSREYREGFVCPAAADV